MLAVFIMVVHDHDDYFQCCHQRLRIMSEQIIVLPA